LEKQSVFPVIDAWSFTIASIPITLVLWLCAFLGADAGQGDPALFLVLYAPLGLLGLKSAVAGGMLLHLAYAACVDLARGGRVATGRPVAMVSAHYLSVGVAAWDPPQWLRPLPGAVASLGVWLPVGLVLFLGWQALLAVGLLRPAVPRPRGVTAGRETV